MPANIFIDLNVILDVLLERKGHVASARVIDAAILSGDTLHISAHMVTTFAYLLEQAGVRRSLRITHLNWLLKVFEVSPVNQEILTLAITSDLIDYEDAVVEQSALMCKAGVIITRNIKDFRQSRVKAVTPEKFLET